MPVEQSLKAQNTQMFSIRKSAPIMTIKTDITSALTPIFASTSMPPGCKFLIEEIRYSEVGATDVAVTFTDEYTTHLGTATHDVIEESQALNFATYPEREIVHPKSLLVEVALSAQVKTGSVKTATVIIRGRMIKGRVDVQD